MKLLYEELQMKYQGTFVFYKENIGYISSINSDFVVFHLQNYHDKQTIDLKDFEFQSWLPKEGYYPFSRHNCSMLLTKSPEKSSSKSFSLPSWRTFVPKIRDTFDVYPFELSVDMCLEWTRELKVRRNSRGQLSTYYKAPDLTQDTALLPLTTEVLLSKTYDNLKHSLYYKDALFAEYMFDDIKNSTITRVLVKDYDILKKLLKYSYISDYFSSDLKYEF